MVKFSQLECFIAVVENGSINSAAEKLFMTQPSMSRILKSLEVEMGKKLLIRNSHGVEPTREGKLFYTYAKSILSELKLLDRLKYEDMDDETFELNISVYSFFIKDKLFVELFQELSSQDITLNIEEATLEIMFENILSGKSEVGIAVINDVEFPAVKSMVTARNMNVEILDVSKLYVHMRKDHELCQNERIYMKDLLDSQYLHIPFDMYSSSRLNIEIDHTLLKQIKQTATVNNYHLLKSLLKSTDCFLFGNVWQSQELSSIGIESRLIENCQIKMYLVKITNGNQTELSLPAQLFLDKLITNYIDKGVYSEVY